VIRRKGGWFLQPRRYTSPDKWSRSLQEARVFYSLKAAKSAGRQVLKNMTRQGRIYEFDYIEVELKVLKRPETETE